MRQVLVLIALVGALAFAIGSLAVAQDTPATPDLEGALCGSPEASPPASPDASPVSVVDASPAAVPSEVVEEIEEAIEEVLCGTPDTSEP
jgi:hypothetical protein